MTNEPVFIALSNSITDTEEFAMSLSKSLEDLDGYVVLLSGEMGAGKTQLIKTLCKQLGADAVSPTFSIVNQYSDDVFHLDLYRIKDEHELLHLNLDEIFVAGNKVFVEWPERLPQGFLQKHSDYTFHIMVEKISETGRKFWLKS